MRLGILVMLAVGLSVLMKRHHLSAEQADLLRYVDTDVRTLRQVADPIEARVAQLLSDASLDREAVRRGLVDEVVPALLRLRRLAEAPAYAGRTPAVSALAKEYQAVIDARIEACRVAVRMIDDDRAEPAPRMSRIRKAFLDALTRQKEWEAHVRQAGRDLGLSAPAG